MERLLLKNLHRPSNNILFAIVILITTVMTTSTVFSQQLSDALRVSRKGLNFNARALSLGNTYSTIGYDYTALLFNPATMAGQKKFSVTMSLNANAFQSTTNYGGNTVDFTTTSSTAGQAGMILPFRLDSTRSFVLGAGFTQSKDFNLGFKFAGINDGSNPSFVEVLAGANDPAARDLGLSFQNFDATGNYTGDQTTLGSGMYEEGFLLDEGGLVHFTFGASVEAVRNVYFGISGSYNTGPYTSDLELSAADSNDVYPAGIETVPGRPETDGFVRADYRVVREKQYSGWDIRFGIMYRLENFIGLSAAFKVPTEHTVTEDIFTFGQSQFAANNSIILTPSMSTSSYSFQPPTEMTVGAMVNLWIITATAEASYLDYSSAKITSGVGELPDRTEINKRIKDQLSDVVNLSAGLEFRLPFTGLSARAGGIYQPYPYQDNPEKFNQKYLTAGFGINSNDAVEFDIGYAYGWTGEFRNSQTDNDSGTEQDINYHTAMFTMKFSL